MLKRILLSLGFAVGVGSAATMTLSQALQEAITHNPGFQATHYDTYFAEATYDSSVAGYLPTISATGGYAQSWLDTHQERTGNVVQDKDPTRSTNDNAGVNLDWTLFQGFSAPLSRHRLRLQLEQARFTETGSEENLVAGVVLAYADLVRQSRLRRALDTSAEISAERVRILQRSFEVGAASRSDLLSARVDWNSDRAALIHQQAALQSARTTLGQILGRGKAVTEVVDSVTLPGEELDLETLLRGLPDHRIDLQLAATNLDLAQISAEQRVAAWLPKVDALAGYNFALTQSDAGIVLDNRTLGPSIGLQINFNLFTGESPWHAYHRAKLVVTSSTLRQQDALAAAEAEVTEAYSSFHAEDSALTLEREGLGYAQENLGLTVTRWKSGSLAYLDARRAQEQYLDAFTQTENSEYNATQSRIDLLRSAGRLESLLGPEKKD